MAFNIPVPADATGISGSLDGVPIFTANKPNPGQHEAHRLVDLTPLANSAQGFSDARTYHLEKENVAEPTQFIVMPHKDTEVWYYAMGTDPAAWDKQRISDAEGLGDPNLVTAAWIKGPSNTTGYGKRSDLALAWYNSADTASDIGKNVYDSFESEFQAQWFPQSNHHMFKSYNVEAIYKGSTSGSTQWPVFWRGLTPLQPKLHGTFGGGTVRPQMNTVGFVRTYGQSTSMEFMVVQGFYIRGGSNQRGGSHIAFANCAIGGPDGGLVSQSALVQGQTLFCVDQWDIWQSVPDNGLHWTGDERTSGLFYRLVKNWCADRVFYDTCGFQPGYDAINNPANYPPGMPNTFENHNRYCSGFNTMPESRFCWSVRAGFSANQARAGEWTMHELRFECNNGGNWANGEIEFFATNMTGTWPSGREVRGATSGVYAGVVQYTTAPTEDRFGLIPYKSSIGENPNPAGLIPGELLVIENSSETGEYVSSTFRNSYTYLYNILTAGAGYRTNALGKVGNRNNAYGGWPSTFPYTMRHVKALNGINPNDSAEATAKLGHESTTDSGIAESNTVNAFHEEGTVVKGWGAASNDRNAAGISASDLLRLCIAAYIDLEVLGNPLGTSTTEQALDHIRTMPDRYYLPLKILNFFNAIAGGPVFDLQATGRNLLVVPDIKEAGFRIDNPESIRDGANPAIINAGDNLNFQDWYMYFDNESSRLGTVTWGNTGNGGLRIHGGVLQVNDTVGNGKIDLESTGQFRLMGTHTNASTVTGIGWSRLDVVGTVSGLAITLSEDAHVLVRQGGKLTVNGTLRLNDRAYVIFDGPAGTAELEVNGTLAIAAESTSPRGIATERSGYQGIEDLGGGVLGQPIDPAVTGVVTLGAASILDLTGSASGTYNIPMQGLSGTFNSVVGGTVNSYAADSVNVTVP